MDRVRFLVEFFGRKLLLVILVLASLLTTAPAEAAPSQANETDKQKVVRQVAQNWIQVGMEQYKRGFYRAAEQSLLRAQDYYEYLTAAERERLNELLEETHVAAIERTRILEHVQTASKLVEQGQLIKAKAHLEKVRDSAFLTKSERQQIVGNLKKIDSQLDKQKKEITELYNRSMEFYRTGQFEKARDGFNKVDSILARLAKLSAPAEAKPVEKIPQGSVAATGDESVEAEAAQDTEPKEAPIKSETNKPALVAVAEPETDKARPSEGRDKAGPVEVTTDRRGNILRSYTGAVVNNAVAKARSYISQGKFDKAKEVVEAAEQVVNKNQPHLGDELFRQYSSQLKQLTEEIVQAKSKKTQ